MIDDRIRAALKNDITARLLADGSKRWKEIQSKYPQVSSATFFRLVAQVKAERAEADELPAEPATSSRESVAEISQQAPNQAGRGAGLQGPVRADGLVSEIALLFEDANLLRSYALDSQGKVKFPNTFVESAKLRDRAIRVAFAMLADIYGVAAQAAYFDALTDAILASDPETQKRLMLAMYEFQQRGPMPARKIPRGISPAPMNHGASAP